MGASMCEVRCDPKRAQIAARWLGAPLRRVLAALVLVVGAGVAAWSTTASAEAARVRACLNEAAQRHQLDGQLLHAIAMVESGLNPHALNRGNANGTRDIGLMQINSSWLPQLARRNITESDLYDPCVSADVGAWILADNIARLGATWRAVGAYNARSTARRLAYVRRVQRQLKRMQSGQE